MIRGEHPDSMRKPNAQWQPSSSPYLQQGPSSLQQRQPSAGSLGANRSASPPPSSPISPGGGSSSMMINTSGSGGAGSRSNPTSPSSGSAAGNAMDIAARHYEALQQYLLAHILKEKHGVSDQRIAAREKLSRLLQNQLQDLSTDVYDELKRRTDGAQVPFLAVRDDFHPKRNQARQKLATLPQNRFKDLASDVYVQLERMFPALLDMFPLKALEEKEFLSQAPPTPQQQQQPPEASTPVVQQSSVVPNVATFTIQDSSNAEEETYYRAPGQGQGPVTPTALDGNVNFASLDSLMADLGNIVSKDGSDPSKAADKKGYSSDSRTGLGIDSGSNSDPVRQEYESRITALCKRLQHLESEVGDAINRPEGSRLAQVERQLAKQTELYSEQSSRTSKLQFEYNKVLNDYNAQLETVDMINQEVKALLMEVKTQKQRNQDTEDELQQAYDRIKNLEDENSDLKADLDDTRRDLDDTRRDMDDTRRDLDDLKQDLKKAEDEAVSARSAAKEAAAVAAASATSVTPAPSVPPTPSAAPAAPMNSSSFGGPKDYMNNHHVNESQHHQDMGLANTSNNLNNLNTIVNSVTGSNNNSNNNSNNISSNISSNISNISSTLNNSNNILNSNVSSAPANTTTSSSTATTTNNNSNNINNNNSNNKDANDDDDSWSQDRQQARDSVMANPTSVIHLDTLNSFRNAVDDLLAAGRSDSSSSVLLGMKSVVIACKAVTEDVDDYELDEPQDDSFADLKQELSSGLSQLMSAAKAHSNNFDEDEDEFDRTLTDLETSADQLEAIVMDIVNVPKRTRGGKMDGGSGGMNNKGYKEKGGRDDVDDEDDMPRKGLNDNKAHKTKLDEPMDALDLKIYLETQTGLIVSSIQTLLTSLRSSSDSRDISDASDEITKIVDEVIRTTRLTLTSPECCSAPQAVELQSQGEMVLEDLENSLDLLNEMREQLETEPELAHSSSAEAKMVKQKLASASFDIAKYTKELVSLIDE